MKNFIEALKDNVLFFSQFMLIVILIFLISYIIEKIYIKKGLLKKDRRILNTKKIALIGMFSAISSILMMFEMPVFFAPPFYKIDLSEIPILILGFAYGPIAAILAEFCKILLKLVFRSTSTAFVGELANFVIGASLILPATSIYLFNKTKKVALLGVLFGTLSMTIFGSLFNAIYLLPKFAQMYGLDLGLVIDMGKAINPRITSLNTFIFYSVVPLNLLKGFVVSLISIFIYKKIRKVL